jgi:glycosyltransferase involved in cell wall biosynthesis
MQSISVLIPAFNAQDYIAETLRSVLAQDYAGSIEIIVVDDGSADNTCRIVRQFPSVWLIRTNHYGVTAARNLAIKESSGALIQYLDADDLLSPGKLAAQAARLDGRPDHVATCPWARFYGAKVEDAKFIPDATWRDLAPLDWIAAAWSDGLPMMFPALWLIPRAIVEAAGPWDDALGSALGEDGEYFTRILLSAKGVVFAADAACYYRSGNASASAKKSPEAWLSALGVLNLIETHIRERENSERMCRGLSLAWQHLAHASYPYRPSLARFALSRAADLHPVSINPEGGRLFKWLSGRLGWQTARRLQVLTGRA